MKDKDGEKHNMGGEIWRARLLLIAAAALYGTNFIFVKKLDETIRPICIATSLRFALAVIGALPCFFLSRATTSNKGQENNTVTLSISSICDGGAARKKERTTSMTWGLGLAGLEIGMWNSVGYFSQAVGLETTGASKSGFICSMSAIVVPFLDLCIGKKLLPRQVVGAVMAVAGVGLLELGGTKALHSLHRGDIVSLIQPIGFGIGFWRMEHALTRYPNEAARLTAVQLFAVFVTSILYCVSSACITTANDDNAIPALNEVVLWVKDPTILGALIWTGIITSALTGYMETLALKKLSAAETTLIFSTEPLWCVVFAAVDSGERLGMGAAIGAALILGGCIFSNTGGVFGITSNKSQEMDVENMRETTQDDNVVAGQVVISSMRHFQKGLDLRLQDFKHRVEIVALDTSSPLDVADLALQNFVRQKTS